jgi:flagellar assembly protein FliH
LSDNMKEMSEIGQTWTSFEMDAFESHFPGENQVKAEFVSLENDEKREKDFTPLGCTEDNQKALTEADKIIKNAQERAVNLEREAYDKGFAQGEKDGLELGNKKSLKIAENIENFLIEVNRIKKDIIKHHEREILEIIFAIAKKIVHCQLNSDDKIIKDAVLEALNLAVEKSDLILKVNPEDLDHIEKLRPEIFTEFKEIKSVTITSDPSVTRGGCLLETPYGDVDARIETRLDKIYQCLEGVFNGA